MDLLKQRWLLAFTIQLWYQQIFIGHFQVRGWVLYATVYKIGVCVHNCQYCFNI